jgi:hypothetical protein
VFAPVVGIHGVEIATLKHRIDAIIAHEYEELRAGGRHAEAIKNTAKTECPSATRRGG